MIKASDGSGDPASRHQRSVMAAEAALAVLLLIQPWAAPARAQTVAQLSDLLGAGKDAAGALGGGGGGGGVGLPSLDQASPSNIAGVLQYCVKNNYLGGGAQSMGSSVLGKLTGSDQAKDDDAFKSGSRGLLETGGGESFGLGGGGGIKEKVTEQVCDLVLKHAQSLL